ncbi:MAG: hypothetical protein ACW96N_00315 [Candidatus Thorarchaeota archaeon]|jgi:hypothetical protein
MKRKKSVQFELTEDEVKQAVILLVSHKNPDLKSHLSNNDSTLAHEADEFVYHLIVEGLLDDEAADG